MKTTIKVARSSMIALPLVLLGGLASAGGLSEPVATPAPAPITPAPVPMGADWTGFYAGGQLGYGELDNDALDDDTSGAVYGVHAGYLYDLGSVVLGGEVDYDASNIESDAPGDGLELDSVARAKLIAGYDAGQFMPYIAAGVAQATTSGAVDGDGTGNFAGLGLSYDYNGAIRFGAEVLQHQFDDFDDIDGLDIDATTATARVSFQF
ncbi:outer membrane protein [Yoonia sediminilitoris]|uniref:Opacity protein-like surface antigen n=1 Tax=Yoonia sediminilitoris TaxID=1286148 RepID=A0A2T6KRZ4_9RHOB|nr:outer membrane beta-barrel protein [Yoonia sediminilitoris]PUB19322.1 opacity protein-like surface antigen [Yoonia sediminilitoris]RCW99490.1 opacity protein-like surface antigen [Yoonia sediminilitoris]